MSFSDVFIDISSLPSAIMKQILNTLFIAILAGFVGFFVGQRFPDALKDTLSKVETVTKTHSVDGEEKTEVAVGEHSRKAVLQLNPLGRKSSGLGVPDHSRALMTKQFFQTQFNIIQSAETIHKAIHEYRLDELWGMDKGELLKQITQQLTVGQVIGTDLIVVQSHADSDEKAQQLVYAIVMSYSARRTEGITSRRNEVLQKIKEKIQFQEDKKADKWKELMTLSKKLGIPYPGFGKPIKRLDPIDAQDATSAENFTLLGKARDEYEREFRILQSLKQAELSEVIVSDLDIDPLKFHEYGWTPETAKMMEARKK